MARADSTAFKVADYLIAFSQRHGDPITNLKMQKLLYYAEGWFLALHNRSLFSDPIEAWVRGPVVRHVWKQYSDYRWNPITRRVREPGVSKAVEGHIEELMLVYGDFSAFTLEKMTHDEPPWQNARRGLNGNEPSSEIISREDMSSYFKQLASGE